MKTRATSVLIIFAAVLSAACPPPPVPPSDTGDGGFVVIDASKPDASSNSGVSDDCQTACDNLRSLGCKEGLADNCASTCRRANGTLTDLNLKCLIAKKTKAEVRTCRSVTCE